MIIWLAAIIPIVVLVFLLLNYREQLAGIEVALLIAVPVVIIWIVKASAEYLQTQDIEYWGGWTTDTRYYEEWNEYIHRTCTRCSSYNSKGECSSYTTYDCSYVEDHPAYWEINGSNGERVSIGPSKFELLCKQFGNKQFVNMHRNYYTKNGDMYQGKWAGNAEAIEPITTQHEWSNRVQASKSVFRFQEVKDKTGLYDHPGIVDGYRQPVVLGSIAQSSGTKRMEYWNAVLGAKKKVRIYTLIYRNLPLQKALDQQALWTGGKKNEFDVAVGLDNKDHVQWADVFSWSDIESLKVEAKNYVIEQSTFNLAGFADWLGPQIDKRWVKKNFHDFDYLSVEPSTGSIILAFILSLIASIVAAIIAVKNDLRSDE